MISLYTSFEASILEMYKYVSTSLLNLLFQYGGKPVLLFYWMKQYYFSSFKNPKVKIFYLEYPTEIIYKKIM